MVDIDTLLIFLDQHSMGDNTIHTMHTESGSGFFPKTQIRIRKM